MSQSKSYCHISCPWASEDDEQSDISLSRADQSNELHKFDLDPSSRSRSSEEEIHRGEGSGIGDPVCLNARTGRTSKKKTEGQGYYTKIICGHSIHMNEYFKHPLPVYCMSKYHCIWVINSKNINLQKPHTSFQTKTKQKEGEQSSSLIH